MKIQNIFIASVLSFIFVGCADEYKDGFQATKTDNAFKYTKKGYVKMTYECEDTGITIKVIDTGMGIPKDKQEMIFGRFEKMDTFNQGTGLGLSICKAIIERCGGKISVESEINEGSTFNVWFPCHAEIIK